MPNFPRYQSKAQPTTSQPSVQAPEDTTGEIIQKVGEVGKTVQDVSVKWSEAMKSTKKTVSLTNNKSEILDIQNEFQNKPLLTEADYKDARGRIEKARLKNSEGLDSLSVLELNYDSKVADIQLENIFKKKSIELDTIATKRAVALEVNNPTPNSFPKIKALFREKIDKGLIDPSVAYSEEVRANNDLGVKRINQDLYQAKTTEEVDAVSQGITSGFYEQGGVTIEPDKKKSLLDIADRAKTNVEKKIEAQQVEALAQNRVDVISGVASGQIDLQNLNIAEISEFDPKLGATLTKAKEFMKDYNPKIPKEQQRVSMAGVLSQSELMKARSYAKSVNDVFMQNDNEKLGEFVLRELEKKGDGTTSSVKLAAFMQLAALKFKANNPKTPEDFDAAKRLNAIKAGFSFLKTSNPYLAGFSILDFIIRNAFSGASTKEEVMQEARSVLEDKVIERYAAVSKLPFVPNKIVDGEASVEDLHSGLNDLEGDEFIGDYGDQSGE